MPSSALIEIGTEELPVGCLDLLYAQGEGNLRKILSKNRLDFKEIHFEATPRRLAFFIQDLGETQKEERTQILGPSHQAAYDAEGRPTQALSGFLKGHKTSLKQIKIQETPRGRYVVLEKVRQGEATVQLFPRLVCEMLASFSFPKMMRWEKSGFRFPRPIRWAVILYGKRVLSFSLADLKTGRTSYGHRFLSPQAFSLSKADWGAYQAELRKRHVMLRREEREAMIRKTLEKKFHQKDPDPDLIHETAGLVEEPFLIQAKFSGTYRDLPEEVLTTCMKKYQKVFACRDGRGNLMNRWVAVLNGKRSNLIRIQRDFENVLESRLRDAQYFYDEDTQEPLEKKVSRLKELVFLGRLGNMETRVVRLKELAKEFASLVGQKDAEKTLERVALLSKADLVTHMVGEFPELQGIVGREYAHEAREANEIARAIGEQYLPKNLAEDYRALAKKISSLGALFGIVDRSDLLVGAFGVGLDPSGSEDPYALRRAGGSVAKLIRAFGFHFSLSELVKKSYDLYAAHGIKLDLSLDKLLAKLSDFLRDRVAFELQIKSGSRPYEILQGVMKSSFDDLADVFERFEALLEFASKEPKIFSKTSKVVERTSNILKGVKEALPPVDPNFFQESLEKELFKLVQEKGPELQTLLKKKDYEGVSRLYGETFFDPLHLFFERVMVNVEDSSIRRNRQALMREINSLYTQKVGDLSLLTPAKEKESMMERSL